MWTKLKLIHVRTQLQWRFTNETSNLEIISVQYHSIRPYKSVLGTKMAISTPMMIPISDTRRQEAIWTNWTRWWVMQYPAGCPYLRGIFRVLLSQYPLNFCAWYLNFVNIFTNVKLAPDSDMRLKLSTSYESANSFLLRWLTRQQ